MKKLLKILLSSGLLVIPVASVAQEPGEASSKDTPVIFTFVDRQRINATQWYAATPSAVQYGHLDTLLRLGVKQRKGNFDWQAEVSQNSELFLPSDGVSPVTEQGQLGLGGTYYAANGNNNYPAAASFKTGFLRYHFGGPPSSGKVTGAVQLGRFEFMDGSETAPTNDTMKWVQTNRMAQRSIGNFGFSNGQRSFDGVTATVGGKNWDLTAMGARAVQGVFNMNGNPELNTDIQYLAYSRYAAQKHLLVRGFAIGYHDGRTGITKVDTRAAAARAADRNNIRIGTYGASAIAAIPAGKSTVDLMFWGLVQNGQWGTQEHRAGAIAAEGGVRLDRVATKPWLRGGFVRTSGDKDPNDNVHGTYFQNLPTPRNYARFPFFNMMNLSEQFVQFVDKPTPKLDVRTDLHFLQLTQGNDMWYLGGGAFDSKSFGYIGRPGHGHGSFGTMYDASVDYAISKQVSLTAYYAHVFGRTVIAQIYPTERNANYGFLELNWKFNKPFSSRP